jgi:hydroxypyruvate reductase
VTFAISDVVGDRPEDIGSGPTLPDPTSLADAKAILARHRIAPPERGWSETVNVEEAEGWDADYRIVASGDTALKAAAAEAVSLGWEPILFDRHAQGEARDVARRHASAAMDALKAGRRAALISGGELTVTQSGKGRGGPGREYLLPSPSLWTAHPTSPPSPPTPTGWTEATMPPAPSSIRRPSTGPRC